MKYDDEGMGEIVIAMIVAVVALAGMICMAVEETATKTEAIKAGLVQDANGRWVKP